MKALPTGLPYVRQIDGLRAIAILLVLFDHFYCYRIMAGAVGVKLFFVISGFLITGILLKCRQQIENSDYSLSASLKRFYIRRTLRIVPVFYLALFICAGLDLPGVREDFWWHFTYLSNFYFAKMGWFDQMMGHAWSLAVEEQFYFVWPWLILLAPKRKLPKLLLALLAIALVICVAAPFTGLNQVAIYTLPFFSLVPLITGALLAVLFDEGFGLSEMIGPLRRVGIMAGLPLLLVVASVHYVYGDQYIDRLLDPAVALLASWLVIRARLNVADVGGRLLSSWPLVKIGLVSYGIYVYHFAVRALLWHIFPWFPHDRGTVGSMSIAIATSIVVAAISWHFFERPINRLKKRFEYPPASEERSTALAPEPLAETL
jgi:peptidoglycan/LPS O-acetylase OafA/YrhL